MYFVILLSFFSLAIVVVVAFFVNTFGSESFRIDRRAEERRREGELFVFFRSFAFATVTQLRYSCCGCCCRRIFVLFSSSCSSECCCMHACIHTYMRLDTFCYVVVCCCCKRARLRGNRSAIL